MIKGMKERQRGEKRDNAVGGVEALFHFRQLIFFLFFGFTAFRILVPWQD